jgi:hypothetical protein
MTRSHVLAGSFVVTALSVAAAIAQTASAPQAPAQPPSAQTAPAPTAAPASPGGTPASLPAALTSCPEIATVVRTVVTNDMRLRDWPSLSRYREANHTVGSVDVVFMGDSITDSWVQPRFGEFFPGKRYAGRGISGQTTPPMKRSQATWPR